MVRMLPPARPRRCAPRRGARVCAHGGRGGVNWPLPAVANSERAARRAPHGTGCARSAQRRRRGIDERIGERRIGRHPVRQVRIAGPDAAGRARDGDRQAPDAQAARSARRGARCAGESDRRGAVRDAGARSQECLHPDLRHHAAGSQPPVPAPAHRGPAGGRHGARSHHRAGGDRPASAERRRGAGRSRRRSLGARHGSRREPLRARRRGARRFRRDPQAAHAGEARPPLRRGGPAHRDRAGRAAFHGGLLGRPEGHRAGDRPRRHDPHVSQRALHGRPGGDPVQSAGQSVARGAARDRADAGRGVCAQHGDRRGSRSRPRQLRRGDRKPSHGGRVRRRAARACPSAGAFRRS